MTTEALRRILVSDDRVARDPDRIELEPATTTAGGLVGSYRAKARPAIELLERRGLVTARQARAARRLYRSHALGIVGAIETGQGTGSGSPGSMSDLRLGAATDYRLSRVAAGPEWQIVYCVCVLDMTCTEYAAEYYSSASGRMVALVMQRLRVGLDRVSLYHEEADAEDDRRRR